MARPLTPAARDRLLKVCRLMASPHSGERAAAALTAARLLAKAGLDWEDVIAAAGSSTLRRPRGEAGPSRADPEAAQTEAFRAEVDFLRRHRHLMTRAENLQFGWYSTVQGTPGPGARQAVAHYARLIRKRMTDAQG